MKRILPIVLNLVQQYGTNDPKELCQCIGIDVIHINIPMGPRGVSLKILDTRYVYLDNCLSKDEKNVTLAHELGHAVLKHSQHRIIDVDIVSKKDNPEHVAKEELEANKFAFLLISHTCLRNDYNMIDGIRNEKLLTIDRVLELLDVFSNTACYIN